MSGPFQPTPYQFLLKLSFTPTCTPSLFFILLSALFTPTILLIQSFSQTCTCSCCFSVSAIVSKSYTYAGVNMRWASFRNVYEMSVSHHPSNFPPSVCPYCNPPGNFGIRIANPTYRSTLSLCLSFFPCRCISSSFLLCPTHITSVFSKFTLSPWGSLCC